MAANHPRPLDGVRVLELGQLMAGPFAGTILGYFGAEVIKVEAPGDGDPIRRWRLLDGDTSPWWHSLARNKRCVTLDLRRAEGQRLARRLLQHCDVLIENFRPGTLERWKLAPPDLLAAHPGLVIVRVSGFGQTGPWSSRPGFASVCEAFGGLRYVTGHPGESPVRANLSLGDSLGGLHAALGALLALRHRDATGRGQVVDLGIFEAVFNMLEATVPEYHRHGAVREPSGTTITGVAPTNLYTCSDGRAIVIGGTGDSIFRRLMDAIGRGDLAADPRFATNAGRVQHQAALDTILGAWAGSRDSNIALEELAAAAVPAAPVYSIADIMADPHYRARALFEEVEVAGRPLALPAIPPRLSETPGRTEWPGPALGADNAGIFRELLGLSEEELEELRASGVV